MSICYFNGKFISKEEASLPIDNVGTQRSYGVFDLMRVRNKIPTFLSDYLDRFHHSQQFLNLSEMIPKDQIEKNIFTLINKNDFQDSTIRLMLLADQIGDEFKPLFSSLMTPCIRMTIKIPREH